LESNEFSESGGLSTEDVEDTYYQRIGCNFDAETAVDSVADLGKINLKESSYEEIMRYHFPDRDAAFMFYNRYACVHGFAGRKSRVVKNINGVVVQQTFLCHREGVRDEKYTNMPSRKREHKPISRCGCQAKIQVHLDLSSECWYIKFFDDLHNHSFVNEKYERMLPAHRKMSEYDKFQMKNMRTSGISTTRIYGYFATQAGGYENLGYSKREIQEKGGV
jgi:zinc finger SWIM domain-containing protein 3